MTDERTHEYTPGLHGWITHTELSSGPGRHSRLVRRGVRVGFSAGLPEPAGGYQVFVYSE
jgi:hypothetical protein